MRPSKDDGLNAARLDDEDREEREVEEDRDELVEERDETLEEEDDEDVDERESDALLLCGV